MKKHESQHEFLPRELTASENQMNGALWAWMLEKARKIDMKVLQNKEFNGH